MEANRQRSKQSVKQLKYGYRLMWKQCSELMEKFGFPKPGQFDKSNGFDGVCWGFKKECTMTSYKAEQIMFELWMKKSLTPTQMCCVSKALCFSHELRGFPKKVNWPSVRKIQALIIESELAPKKFSVVPTKVPSVAQLKAAFDTEYSEECTWTLIPWLLGLICAFDCFLNGPRSGEDVKRIKNSPRHVINAEQGWMSSEYNNGRCKLGDNKTRAWWHYTICLCRGAKHVSPHEDFRFHVRKDGSFRKKPTWTTTCPLAACELVFSMLPEGEKRRYPNWKKTGGFGKLNIADPVHYALKWLVCQGIIEEPSDFDHNSGRKAFARLCRAMGLEYPPIFEIVGDLEDTWRKSYDFDLPKSGYKKRDQSRDPQVATEALRTFRLMILKRGGVFMPRLSRQERLLYEQLRLTHGEEAAKRALFGTDDELVLR